MHRRAMSHVRVNRVRLRRKSDSHSATNSALSGMKQVWLEILGFVLIFFIHYSSTEEEKTTVTLLKKSQFRLHSFGTNAYLFVQTEEPVTKPKELVEAYVCSLSGKHILGTPIDLKLSLVQDGLSDAVALQNNFGGNKIIWDGKNPYPHTYVLHLTSVESGYITCKCKDCKGNEEIMHNAEFVTAIVVKYGVSDISEVVEAVEGNDYFPLLVSINTDTSEEPEITIRIESKDPKVDEILRESALEMAKESNWTVRYVRESTFCPLVEEGNFTWPRTGLGRRATPIVPCVDRMGYPGPSRRCLGDLVEGAYWEILDHSQSCSTVSKPEPALLDVIQKSSKTDGILHKMQLALRGITNPLGPIEVNLLSLALSSAARNGENVALLSVVNILDVILLAGKKTIWTANDVSSTSENILDALDEIVPRSTSNSSSPIIGNMASALSFDDQKNFLRICAIERRSMIGIKREDGFERISILRPKAAMFVIEGPKNLRVDYMVMKDAALFRSYDLRKKVLGPSVGIRAAEHSEHGVTLTVAVAFARDKNDPVNVACGTWYAKYDEEWLVSKLGCSKGTTNDTIGSEMDVCVCTILSNGFTFFSRMVVEELDNGNSFGSKESKPMLELMQKKEGSEIILNVYDRQVLDAQGYILNLLKCSVRASFIKEYPLGWNPRKSAIVYQYNNMDSSYLPRMATFKVSYEGDGIMRCSDRLGLSLTSNYLMLRRNNVAIVKYAAETSENVTQFMEDYVLKYGQSFRMEVGIQQPYQENEFILRFYKSFVTNYWTFLEHVRDSSDVLAREYDWKVLYVRSTGYCLSSEDDDFKWPTTKIRSPSIPVVPCVDSFGVPSPSRECLGNYLEGSYWMAAPKRPDPCGAPSERATRLRRIWYEDEEKIRAMEKTSEVIDHGPSLDPYEVWILSSLLKDAAAEVSEAEKKLLDVSHFATIVNSIQEAGKDVLRVADRSTGSSKNVRESIDVLLAASATSSPTIISKPHFSALAAFLDSGVKGFAQYKSGALGEQMESLEQNTTLEYIGRKSPRAAAYFKTFSLKEGILTTTLFENDSLFGAPTPNKTVSGPVIGMTLLSGTQDSYVEYDQPLELLLLFPRDNDNPAQRMCEFWNEDEEGSWSGVGCELLPEEAIPEIKGMVACICTHITYFAQLIMPRSLADTAKEQSPKTENHNDSISEGKEEETSFNTSECTGSFFGEGVSCEGSSNLITKLNSSKIELYSLDIHLFLMVQTEEAIENPDTLQSVFECTLTGRHLLEPPIDLAISLHKTSSFAYIFNEAGVEWNEKYNFRHQYMLRVTSYESGFVKCLDKLRIGLQSKDIAHAAGYVSSVEARYAVSSIPQVVKAVMNHEDVLSLIYIDSDKISEPEMTIRFESRNSYYEKSLKEEALEFAKENNLTVRYIRGSTYCPSEVEGNFTWPMTRFGRRAAPINPCIDEKGFIGPSRRCLGNLLEGAYWETIEMEQPCLMNSTPADALLSAVNREYSNTLEIIQKVVENKPQLEAADVNLVSVGLNIVATKGKNISMTSVLEVIDAILGVDKEILQKTSMTSSSLETILDIIDQILMTTISESRKSIFRKHLSAVSFHAGDFNRGFAVAGTDSILFFGESEKMDKVLKHRPEVAVFRVGDPINQRMDFLVIKDDTLFRSFDQRIRVAGPIVGIGIKDASKMIGNLTLLIAFKTDKEDPTERRCAAWNPRIDTDWSTSSAIFRTGMISVQSGPDKMSVCSYNVMQSGFIFFTQILEENTSESTYFHDKNFPEPRMELIYKEWTSTAFLNVDNDTALEVRGPLIDSLECSLIYDDHLNIYPVGSDLKNRVILYEQMTFSSKYLRRTKIFKLAYSGEGNLSCRDKLGLGLVSNEILITSQNVAVVSFARGPKDNLKEFIMVYPFNYGKKFGMSVRIQFSGGKNFSLRFSQSSEKNDSRFLRDVEVLSGKLEVDYNWKLLYIRSVRECPAVEETVAWPTTPAEHYTVPMDPFLDDEGFLFPKRLCRGSYEEGFYWEKEPHIPDERKKLQNRAEALKDKAELKDKMFALDEIARIISVIGRKKLNLEEVWIVSRVLKDAADEVIDKGSKLQNVTSLAILVNFMQSSRKSLLKLAANSIDISIRESINILLASSVTSTPTNITTPRFSAVAAFVDDDIKGFELHQSVTLGRSIVMWSGNSSIEEIGSGSLTAAVYIQTNISQSVIMVATVFQDSSLFGSPTKGRMGGSVVGTAFFSEELLEYDQPLEIIVLIERDLADYVHGTCQFWNPNRKEKWSDVGCKHLPRDSIPGISDMDACICTHAAYYAFSIDLTSMFIDVVPTIGCYIFLLCLIIIFIVAISNRKNLGERKKIALQIALIHLLQVIIFIALFSNGFPTKMYVSKWGVSMGATVHFCLLASTLWSFISALHSTLEFNHSLRDRLGNHYLLIASFCGWAIPLFLVSITVLIEHNSYARIPWTVFCYPEGIVLYIFKLIPLTILILANFTVLYMLFRFRKQSPYLFSSFLHFILVLLFWIFALIILFDTRNKSSVTSYLFLIVTSIHGGIMMFQSVFCHREYENSNYIVGKSGSYSPNSKVTYVPKKYQPMEKPDDPIELNNLLEGKIEIHASGNDRETS